MENNEYINIPEDYSRTELNRLYREKGIENKTSVKLRKYFNAFAHLYGALPLPKAFEIVSSQNNADVTEEVFYNFAEIARHENENYFILGAEDIYIDGKPTTIKEKIIVEPCLIENFDAYHEILRQQNHKPFYIPCKTTLLKYSELKFFEQTAETDAILNFFKNTLKFDEEKSMYFLQEIMLYFSAGDIEKPYHYILEHFSKIKLFKKEKQWIKFSELLMELNNNARTPFNCGHTPNEIRKLVPAGPVSEITIGENMKKMLADGTISAADVIEQVEKSDVPREVKKNIFQMMKDIGIPQISENTSSTKKVGRNDPCPCGSGKKYKKCCGSVS